MKINLPEDTELRDSILFVSIDGNKMRLGIAIIVDNCIYARFIEDVPISIFVERFIKLNPHLLPREVLGTPLEQLYYAN